MDVRISSGAFAPKPAMDAARGEKPVAATPFSALLRAAETENAPVSGGESLAAQTSDEVFARALADRNNPDLNALDEYMERLIQNETSR